MKRFFLISFFSVLIIFLNAESIIFPMIQPCTLENMDDGAPVHSDLQSIQSEESSNSVPSQEMCEKMAVADSSHQTVDFPDLGGILDLTHPFKVRNQLFVLTNPKSGSHLLLYSIMKITKKPIRQRVPYWHYVNDPPYFYPDNIMHYPISFDKQTLYWGHECNSLQFLNHSKNKLIFILRDYKENISSCLIHHMRERFKNGDNYEALGELLLEEVLSEGMFFKDYMKRLVTFDKWNPKHRCLVFFEDLAIHPENFVPQVMQFIEDDSDYCSFIENYEDFKIELMQQYDKKQNRTGSGSDLKYFSRFISPNILEEIDQYIKAQFPILWERYLRQFEERCNE